MIRLYSLCKIYIVCASLYYAWYLALFGLTNNFPGQINLIAFFSVYWFLAVILYFYFRFNYLISYRRFVLACGWSFVNILLFDWIIKEIHFYFFYISLLLIPFCIYQVYRISEKMKTNIRDIDENGEPFEIEYIEEYEQEQEQEQNNENKPAAGNQ